MTDIAFVALAEGVITYVDERFGRVAAWIVGIVITAVLPVAIVACAIWRYIG